MSFACPDCGSVVPDAARFCPRCGTMLPSGHFAAPVLPPQVPAPPVAARFPPLVLTPPVPFVPVGGASSEWTLELGFGRVAIGPQLGDGGMGRVFRGWLYFDPRGPQAGTPPADVAVKVLHPALVGRAEVRRLFVGEAEALRRLSHPNIVRFFGLSEDEGKLAIAMEFVDGQPLSSVIERHVRRARPGALPAMPFARAWHYFQQLLGALAATHELGIVHRDVKPANVLVRRDGFVKLTDFGIARLPADVAKTTGGIAPGTGAYMSPEQVMGAPLDGRSDLYAAAIVLYEMLSGHTPFEAQASNEFEVRACQVEKAPPPLTERVSQAPPIIDQLFARALAKSPSSRYATALEFGNAFCDALGLPDTAGWRAQKALAGNALGIAGAPAVRAKQGTVPVTLARADEFRQEVQDAYAPAAKH